MKNNTSSEVKDFISLKQIQDMKSLDKNSNISLDERKSLLTPELKQLGASPAQIQVALAAFNDLECKNFNERCTSHIHRRILTRYHYEKFSKLLILSTEPTQELIDGDLININIKRDHPPIPAELKTTYDQLFSSQDLYSLGRKHADLYLKIIDRGLQTDGTINPKVAIPEMATVFEKLEKQFLLLERAVKINPTGLQTFFKTFGFTNPQDIKKISQGFTDNINSLRQFYNPILNKIKANDWNGLEYMDLMRFYSGFYASLDFSNITKMAENLATVSSQDKESFFNNISIYTERKDLLFDSVSSPFKDMLSNVNPLLEEGQFALISSRPLKEYTPFLTHMAVPIFSIEVPDVFMRGFDETTSYSSNLIKHDISHPKEISNSNISNSVSKYLLKIQKMSQKPSLQEMKLTIKSMLNSNLIELKRITIILNKLNPKDASVFDAFMLHSYHEGIGEGYNFVHNDYTEFSQKLGLIHLSYQI